MCIYLILLTSKVQTVNPLRPRCFCSLLFYFFCLVIIFVSLASLKVFGSLVEKRKSHPVFRLKVMPVVGVQPSLSIYFAICEWKNLAVERVYLINVP